jgi:hypothetical protein
MQISPAIAVILERLTACGLTHVYNYMPISTTGTLLIDAWQEGDILHGITVLRDTAGRLDDGDNYPRFIHQVAVEVRRTYTDAASQTAHDDELDTILKVFWGDLLDGTIASVNRVRLTENRPYSFYNNLVHFGRIELELETP